jgi:hypothetical protein
MFAPPATLEMQGRWRGDTKSIFDATSIKVDLGRTDNRVQQLKTPQVKQAQVKQPEVDKSGPVL